MKRTIGCCLGAGLVWWTSAALVVAQEGVPMEQRVAAACLATLPKPAVYPELGESNLLVFTQSPAAQEHVRQGFALIHASWDFEAYRHFVAALQEDPQCLMAYCGVVMSLSSPQHEFQEQRAKAYNRMLTLAEYKVDDAFYYPENERMYAVAIAELIANGLDNSLRVFKQIARDYPQDSMAQYLATYLARGGYNALGNPRASQREAVEKFQKIVAENPADPVALNFLIMLQAEAPYQAVDFKEEILPLALKLSELGVGKMPTWQALLGFVAWRSGDAALAEKSYREAIALFQQWQQENGVSSADNEGLLRAQLYLAEILHEQGRFEEADAVLKDVQAVTFEKGREFSAGALTQKWGAGFLPFSMLLDRGRVADAQKALPKPLTGNLKNMDAFSAIVLGYELYAQAEVEFSQGKVKEAQQVFGKLTGHLEAMQQMQEQVAPSPEFAYFLRSLGALNVLHSTLTARFAEKDGLAFNWYQSAMDAQMRESRLLPPAVLFPVEFVYGQYQQKSGNLAGAKQSFEQALKRRPAFLKARIALEQLEQTAP